MYRSEDIERDLREYFTKELTMDRETRLRYLVSLFNHKDELRTLTHKIDSKDVSLIISMGGARISKMKMPVFVSNTRLDQQQTSTVALIEAVLGYLNLNNLLLRPVDIAHTTDEYDFEPLED